jgi:prepilin peptidase CpaA
MLHYATSATLFLFSVLIIYGALSDLSTFKIPNWVSYGLIILFAVYAFMVWLNTPFTPSLSFRLPFWAVNLIIGLVVFIMSVIFWKFRFIGGGDVKFLTATSLWMGPQRIVIFLILLTGLAVVFVLFLKFLHLWNPYFQMLKIPKFFKRAIEKAQTNELPYGFPIGLAALILIPGMFASAL